MPAGLSAKPGRGDPIRPSAQAMGSMMDAAADLRNHLFDQGGPSLPAALRGGCVFVQNQTGSLANQFDVCAITGTALTPAAGDDARNVMLTVNVPGSGDEQRLCVLQEPIASGAVGIAMISGLTPVNVTGADSDGTAAVTAGQPYLTAGNGGAAQILWSASGTDLRLAVVRLPTAKGPSASQACWSVATVPVTSPMVWPTTVDGRSIAAWLGGTVLVTEDASGCVQSGLYQTNSDGTVWTYVGRPAMVPVIWGATRAHTLWAVNPTPGSGPYYLQYMLTDFPSGGATTGKVLTAQADGSVAFQTAPGAAGGSPPDNDTLDLNGSSLMEIKPGGVGASQLAALAVTPPKISSGAATSGQVLTADGAGAAAFQDAPSGGHEPDDTTLALNTDTPPKLEVKAGGITGVECSDDLPDGDTLDFNGETPRKLSVKTGGITGVECADELPDGDTLDWTDDSPRKLEVKDASIGAAQISGTGTNKICDETTIKVNGSNQLQTIPAVKRLTIYAIAEDTLDCLDSDGTTHLTVQKPDQLKSTAPARGASQWMTSSKSTGM